MSPSEEDIAWLRSSFHPVPRPQLPDDCVEYSLYAVSTDLDPTNDSETRLLLRDVQKAASDLQKKWLREYIWQRQGFALELVREDGEVLAYFGDEQNMGTRSRTNSDGEFLLIEAAGILPKWLEPEVAENRVWIHNGGLVIIKPLHEPKTSNKQTLEKLSLQEAQQIILKEPKRLLHSTSIEEEAFYRLRNYPQQIADSMHHALVTLPRTIAFLLHQKPAYIAPAVEAFYLRDPIALKPLQVKNNDKLVFQPEDLVTVSATFPRVGYAQLKSQDFRAPPVWADQIMSHPESSKGFKMVETGMKIVCGFEMLVSDIQNQDRPAVREIKMILEDLESGDEKLPSNEEIATWDRREDNEKWLDISFEDLQGELAGSSRSQGARRGEFGDKAAQENLQRIVTQFEQFLNDDKAGVDGAGLFDEESDEDLDDEDEDDDDSDKELDSAGEDKDASFDEDEFTKMMREMMGMPREVMQELMSTKATREARVANLSSGTGRVEELDSDSGDNDEEMQSMLKRMEAELNETGVLNLDPTPRKVGATQRAVKGKGKAKASEPVDEESDESDDGEENDVDVNLARNLLESFKSQGGLAGPGGNLMGMMGLHMPRDEKQEDADN